VTSARLQAMDSLLFGGGDVTEEIGTTGCVAPVLPRTRAALNRQTGCEEVVLHAKPSDNQCEAHFSTSRRAAQVLMSSRPSKKDGSPQGGRRQAMPLVRVHSSPAVIGAGLPERRFWSVTDKPQGRSEQADSRRGETCDGGQ
jgi:hypothetical protein